MINQPLIIKTNSTFHRFTLFCLSQYNKNIKKEIFLLKKLISLEKKSINNSLVCNNNCGMGYKYQSDTKRFIISHISRLNDIQF
jgi:hypothetical protein